MLYSIKKQTIGFPYYKIEHHLTSKNIELTYPTPRQDTEKTSPPKKKRKVKGQKKSKVKGLEYLRLAENFTVPKTNMEGTKMMGLGKGNSLQK